LQQSTYQRGELCVCITTANRLRIFLCIAGYRLYCSEQPESHRTVKILHPSGSIMPMLAYFPDNCRTRLFASIAFNRLNWRARAGSVPTYGFEVRCSIQLSYGRSLSQFSTVSAKFETSPRCCETGSKIQLLGGGGGACSNCFSFLSMSIFSCSLVSLGNRKAICNRMPQGEVPAG
jgi:hypothetical protein